MGSARRFGEPEEGKHETNGSEGAAQEELAALGRVRDSVSTRVEGDASAAITITARATLAAGMACLMLTVTEEAGGMWKFNLSEREVNRVGFGRLTARDHVTALRRAAVILADGYAPGTVERGLLETFAEGKLSGA